MENENVTTPASSEATPSTEQAAVQDNISQVSAQEQAQANDTHTYPQTADEAFQKASIASTEKFINSISTGDKSVEDVGEGESQPDGEGQPAQENGSDQHKEDGSTDNNNVDWNSREFENKFEQFTQQKSNEIREVAHQETIKYLEDNKIRTISIRDLQQVDEDGMVTWKNPDNPNDPFTNRRDANSFVEDFNKEVQRVYQEQYNKSVNEWVKKITPYINLERFKPRFNAMDKRMQDAFIARVGNKALYAVGPNGQVDYNRVVGFDCDLDAEADALEQVINAYSKKEEPQSQAEPEKEEPPETPAVAAQTSNVDMKDNEDKSYPTTADEAFAQAQIKNLNKQLDEINKKKGNKNDN